MVKRLSRGLDRDPIIPLPFGPTAASVVIATGDYLVVGYSVKETTGVAAASFSLFDGIDATGTRISPVTLSAGQSREDVLPTPGIDAFIGVFLRIDSGTVEGTLYLRDV